MRTNQKVCFVGGAGHSGSTLLGFILGSHADGFYAGEAAKARFLQDPSKRASKRTCKFCGESCPVWSTIRLDHPLDLYEQLSRKTRCSLVVDSAKHVDWIRQQVATVAATSAQPFFIFLHRDGRAVINSRIRKYPHKSVEDLIQDWVDQIQATQALFDELSCPKTKVSYEQLASLPAPTTQQICEFLGIAYCPEMLHYGRREHHVLGGNNGTQFLVAKQQFNMSQNALDMLSNRNQYYYEHHAPTITLDLRWRQEFPPDVEHLFNQRAGDLNQAFRWDKFHENH